MRISTVINRPGSDERRTLEAITGDAADAFTSFNVARRMVLPLDPGS